MSKKDLLKCSKTFTCVLLTTPKHLRGVRHEKLINMVQFIHTDGMQRASDKKDSALGPDCGSKIGNETEQNVEIKRGVRQGCLSPDLLSFYSANFMT